MIDPDYRLISLVIKWIYIGRHEVISKLSLITPTGYINHYANDGWKIWKVIDLDDHRFFFRVFEVSVN